jgi:hypothetical protein
VKGVLEDLDTRQELIRAISDHSWDVTPHNPGTKIQKIRLPNIPNGDHILYWSMTLPKNTDPGSKLWRLDRPDLQSIGLQEYDLAEDLIEWQPSFENRDSVQNQIMVAYMQIFYGGPVSQCLGYEDGLKIQELDPRVYHRLYGNKALALWKSSVTGDKHEMYLPIVRLVGDRLVLELIEVANPFDGELLTLIFKKEEQIIPEAVAA